MTSQVLACAATLYGIVAAFSSLLQARQMLKRRESCDVSARFFAAYAGGYAIWLLYGISIQSPPLIVVDLVGVFCGGLTLSIALSLRGSLLHPRSWTGCQRPSQRDEIGVHRALITHVRERIAAGETEQRRLARDVRRRGEAALALLRPPPTRLRTAMTRHVRAAQRPVASRSR